MTNTITRQDLIPLNTYRRGREEYLQKMITYKNNRRIQLSEHISLLFENRNTVLFQIQELVNCEDLEDPQEIDEYIDIYSDMIPNGGELSATLFIELDDQSKLSDLLVSLKGIEHHLMMMVENEEVPAVFEEVHDDREFTTSVHYLKFPMTQNAKNLFSNGPTDVALILNHPNLTVKIALTPQSIKSLQKDLA
jgi:hypothetical protein